MNNSRADENRIGKVYLIGAGPGDPGLITIKGMQLLARAEVVVTDRLVNSRLLDYTSHSANIIYAGKASRDHTIPQDDINNLLINSARQGKTVVRLKGGDPFVFGRGGEEAVALAEAGIEYEVVPGVTSAIAVPAYAGIPVTSRGYSTSFGVITGHEAPDKLQSSIRWDRIATGLDTLVFLMGVERLPEIVEQLIANGRSPETPVALVRWGTYSRQETMVGTLSNIVGKAEQNGFSAPAVTIIGEVVNLRETINWFENKPLFGKLILVTRAEHQAGALTLRLEEMGAEVEEIPVIKFIAPTDPGPLDDAIKNIARFDWILFTSSNGVEWFVRRLCELGLDIRAIGGVKIGTIGPKTAAALADMRLRVDYFPSEYVSEAVVREFPENLAGKSILIPRTKEARNDLPDGLRAMGADVRVVCAYETVLDTSRVERLRTRLSGGHVDMITFTSASTVENFLKLADGTGIPDDAQIACIGPITADAVRAHGLKPTIVAEEYTIDGLVNAISAFACRCANK